MTISSVGSGSHQYSHFDAEQLNEGGISIAGEIAVLMLETQENKKQNDREQLLSARQDFSVALQHEVTALKAKADATFTGALVQCSLTVASSGLEVWGEAREVKNPWQSKAARVGELAAPLGAMAGKSYGEADAKSAEGVETAAKWQIDDARKAVDDSGSKQDKALDWLRSVLDQDAATMTAILSNKV